MNLPKTITIEVTSEDIWNGRRSRCMSMSCPVAIAATRILSDYIGSDHILTAHYDGIYVREGVNAWGNAAHQYQIPPEVSDFMQDFDTRKSVHPVTFTATLKEKE